MPSLLPQRVAGGLLLFAAFLGTILSIAGLVVMWRSEPALTNTVLETLDLFDRTLTVTDNVLTVSDQTLSEVSTNIAQIETSLTDSSVALHSTSISASDLARLVGTDLPDTVDKTQTALNSMQKSAKFMDDFLGFVGNIPFIGAPFKPDVPLQDSINQVSTSLDAVPPDLKTMESQLKETSTDFANLQKDTDQLAEDIGKIKTHLSDANQVIRDYQQIIKESQDRLGTVRAQVRTWIRIAAWAGTALMVWLLLAQFSLFTQGLELFNRKWMQGREDHE